ncbi:hypothetical protein AB0M05_35825 [Streptomyces violaceusniger]|uniref:hypothetical protein n=1 Tax=Streptomyces violaceusniger TaxID=68280 RepID=UPI00341B952C
MDIVLSASQHAVLRGFAGGHDLEWIAANSGASLDVVRTDAHELMALVGAESWAHLIHRGWNLGLLGPGRDEAASSSTDWGRG